MKILNYKRKTIVKSGWLLFGTVLALAFGSLKIGADTHSIRILFIGNSYTYFNNLPEMLTKLAEYGHQSRLETRMVAPGGMRLKDHWDDGNALKALHDGKWDYVVLQEQSALGNPYFVEGKSRIAGDEVFRPYAEKWSAEISKAGAIPLYYAHWARKATPEDQATLNYAYVSAAKKTGAQIAPVGLAWEIARRQHPGIELFYSDGSHPGPAGTYLAACTFYAAIFKQNPLGLPGKVTGIPVNLDTEKAEPDKTTILVDLPPDQARSLQTAAWSAYQELAKHGGYLTVSPIRSPSFPMLPAGLPLSPEKLEGSWTGKILYYLSGPVDMALKLERGAAAWKGHLDLKFHSKDQADESLELSDLKVGASEITFTDPKSVSNLAIHFRGVSPRVGQLQGIADASLERPDSPPVRVSGTWNLKRALPR